MGQSVIVLKQVITCPEVDLALTITSQVKLTQLYHVSILVTKVNVRYPIPSVILSKRDHLFASKRSVVIVCYDDISCDATLLFLSEPVNLTL